MTKCLIEGCERPVKARGLCVICYQTARNKVSNGSSTWDQLVAARLAKPAQHRGAGGGEFGVAFDKSFPAEIPTAPQ